MVDALRSRRVFRLAVASLLVASTLACEKSASPPATPADGKAVGAAQDGKPATPPAALHEQDRAQPSDPVDAGIAELLERLSIEALHALTPQQQLDAVYDRLFQSAAMPTTQRPVEPSNLPAELAATGIGKAEGPWYVWDGRGGEFKNPVLRYFFALRPAAGALVIENVSKACTAKRIRCWLKVLQLMEAYPRTNAAVLFVEDPDATVARSISVDFVNGHPDAVYPDVMPFAERVMPGLSTADEPTEPWPQLGAPHSFGSFIAATIVEAIATVPDGAGAAEVSSAVKKRLSHYGVDPRRPWRRGSPRPRRKPRSRRSRSISARFAPAASTRRRRTSPRLRARRASARGR